MINANTHSEDDIHCLIWRILHKHCIVCGRVSSDPIMQGNLTVFDIKTWFVCSGSYSYNCSGTLRLIVKGPIRLELGQAIQADGIIGLPVRFHPSQKSPSFSPRSFTRHHNSRGRFPPGHTTASHRSTGEDLHKQGIHAVLRVPFA